jgi:hypothetical protein
MKRFACAFVLVVAFFGAALPDVARAAADCAFEDVNDNGIFDLGDTIVTDAQWIGGTAFSTPHPFVVPAGCVLGPLVTVPLPLQGVVVTATKITFLGNLTYLPPGGKGVVLIADPAQTPQPPGLGDGSITIGDGISSGVKIEAGGYNTLNRLLVPAIPQKSVALWAAGPCVINKAELIGNRPIQDTRVGVLCDGDVTIRDSTIRGSRVNIQSLEGKIDARSFTSAVGNNLANACDDPALNIVGGGGAPGNANGFLDPGDFPCQLNLAALSPSPVFNNEAQLLAFCQDPNRGGRNVFQAFNDPLVMIAKTELDLRGVDGGETELLGRYRVTLAAEDGNINVSHTAINHGSPPVPGGAKIFLFADPAAINRIPASFEDFTGPSAGTTNIESACFESTNKVEIGRDAVGVINVTGTPDPAPCKQFPADFLGILSKNF